MWVLVANLRHDDNKALAGALVDADAHFFTSRNVIIPSLLQLAAPNRGDAVYRPASLPVSSSESGRSGYFVK